MTDLAVAEWETFPLDPTWKGCGECCEDALGARVGIRPKVEGLTPAGQMPEGIVVRVCSNCGHVTTMGPILPAIAAEWPAAPEPEVGSPAWLRRRKDLWDQDARSLMAALVKYEDEHPDDAICLAPALEAARRTVPRA